MDLSLHCLKSFTVRFNVFFVNFSCWHASWHCTLPITWTCRPIFLFFLSLYFQRRATFVLQSFTHSFPYLYVYNRVRLPVSQAQSDSVPPTLTATRWFLLFCGFKFSVGESNLVPCEFLESSVQKWLKQPQFQLRKNMKKGNSRSCRDI